MNLPQPQSFAERMELEREMFQAAEKFQPDSPFLSLIQRRLELWLAEILSALPEMDYISDTSLQQLILKAAEAGDEETRNLAIKEHLSRKDKAFTAQHKAQQFGIRTDKS